MSILSPKYHKSKTTRDSWIAPYEGCLISDSQKSDQKSCSSQLDPTCQSTRIETSGKLPFLANVEPKLSPLPRQIQSTFATIEFLAVRLSSLISVGRLALVVLVVAAAAGGLRRLVVRGRYGGSVGSRWRWQLMNALLLN